MAGDKATGHTETGETEIIWAKAWLIHKK